MTNDDPCRIFGALSIGLSDEYGLAAMKSISGLAVINEKQIVIGVISE